MRVTRRNARFQQWEALLGNRAKRQRAGEFLVQGVRPISLAVDAGWPIRALLHEDGRPLSAWARDIHDRASGERYEVSAELMRELGEKDDETPELLAVAELPPDDFARLPAHATFLGVVFDRPSSPGNIGTIVRSVDAFGGHAVIVAGHSADPYDPKAVRASTGSLFSVPVVRARSARDVLDWAKTVDGLTIVGTDEKGDADLDAVDLTGPTLLVIGNETAGLSGAWRDACDVMSRIPITGTASSLNAANAATVALYEAARQR
ncbi:TrmH family RNA methyltransferase [Actinomadura rayongensis]|uniref:rRNA methyltransferase n=1 Tax=Actinomadura rayongensis TaxID=1429076 RepID=A0A6I4W635_9ACTN|nr:rRNA methyltransferase [Actinomadura rayongensis]